MLRASVEPISSGRVTLTLYDLIQAVQETLAPSEEALAVPLIAHILESGRVAEHGRIGRPYFTH